MPYLDVLCNGRYKKYKCNAHTFTLGGMQGELSSQIELLMNTRICVSLQFNF